MGHEAVVKAQIIRETMHKYDGRFHAVILARVNPVLIESYQSFVVAHHIFVRR
jgi:hypothetical protein